jgi:spermidine synthase
MDILAKRQAAAGGLDDLNYYTPALHIGAFALPRYVEKLLG